MEMSTNENSLEFIHMSHPDPLVAYHANFERSAIRSSGTRMRNAAGSYASAGFSIPYF
jgi:hypothetical protein